MDARDRILAAAATVFAETGFRGATTRRIAQEAGVNEITLFRHFGTKERLLLEACALHLPEPGHAPLPEQPRRPRAELRAWARAHHDHLTERRSFIRTCMAEVEEHPDMARGPGSQTERTMVALAGYLSQLKAGGWVQGRFEPRTAALMLLGVLFADAIGRDIMPEVFGDDRDASIDQYVDLFLRGLGYRSLARRTQGEKTA